MEIINIILGYGPILFTGAIAGTVASYLAPVIIKKLKANFNQKRIDELYQTYLDEPDRISKKSPELLEFFKNEGWKHCDCSSCSWLQKKDAKLLQKQKPKSEKAA